MRNPKESVNEGAVVQQNGIERNAAHHETEGTMAGYRGRRKKARRDAWQPDRPFLGDPRGECLLPSSSASRKGGTLLLAGRSFAIQRCPCGLGDLYRSLASHLGVVLRVDQGEPLLVLPFGRFLRACRFRDPVENGMPKTPKQVSGAHDGRRA